VAGPLVSRRRRLENLGNKEENRQGLLRETGEAGGGINKDLPRGFPREGRGRGYLFIVRGATTSRELREEGMSGRGWVGGGGGGGRGGI